MLRLAVLSFLVMVATPAVAAETTVRLAVQNMTCALCPITVRAALKHVAGVRDVTVDFDKKLATVVFDDGITSLDELTAATKDAGYPSERQE
jgi:mercuric ion binding protein